MIYQKTATQRQPEVCVKNMNCDSSRLDSGPLTIWGRSRESLPMVLKTRSWSLLTIPSRSSPREAIVTSNSPKRSSVDVLRKVIGFASAKEPPAQGSAC